MSDEKLKEEIKQVVTNLGNIKFTVEDELEFCKQVLKRKEQECEELEIYIESNEQQVKEVEKLVMDNDRLINELDQLKQANDEKNELLAQLGCPTVGTARRLTLSLKEQLEAYKMEAEEGIEINAELKAENEELKKLIAQDQCFQNKSHKCVKSFYIDEKFKQTLIEIKEIAENREIFCENCGGGVESFTCDDCGYVKILQKINECEVEKW